MSVGKQASQNQNTTQRVSSRLGAVAFLLLVAGVAMTSFEASGANAKKPAASSGKAGAAPAVKKEGYRKKELNFEERVIEGLSNRGYESLSQTGTTDALKGEKLYRKRAEFDEDSKSLLREMEYLK